MSLIFLKNGVYTVNKTARLTNISPGLNPLDVATIAQTVLITPTQTVTQASSLGTGVILNATKGLITTVNATTAALSATTFTVSNNIGLTATSNVEAYISDYAGTVLTNGVPSVYVRNRTATGFDIVIYNAHATNALSGILNIGFEVKV